MADRTSRHLDRLGKLCEKGRDVAAYLYQVPDDTTQWHRLEELLDGIIEEATKQNRRELPRIARELKQQLATDASIQTAELMQAGFDRMFKLWEAARSGMF